jgi:hypothetical protein
MVLKMNAKEKKEQEKKFFYSFVKGLFQDNVFPDFKKAQVIRKKIQEIESIPENDEPLDDPTIF